MSDKLYIYLGAQLIGVLAVDRYGMLSFQYDADYLNQADAKPISCSLPLVDTEYYGGSAHAFFVGLLPEQQEREVMARVIGTSPDNDFRLLKELGKETVGGLTIGVRHTHTPEYKPVNLSDFKAKLETGNSLAPDVYKNEFVRLSLAGAQSKIGLFYQDGQYYYPIDGAPSNVLLKPQSPRFEHLVENEYLTMHLAARCGIQTPKHWMLAIDGIKAYVVERFDRETKGKDLVRLMQEDFCQALGVPPANKYEDDGGPGFVQCIDLIRAHSYAPILDVQRFVRQFIFNFLVGNRDAHGKNYSFLVSDKRTLAPAYDLVCTSMYAHLNDQMAMKINGKSDDELVDAQDWEALAQAARLSKQMVLQDIQRMKAVLRTQVKLLAFTTEVDSQFLQTYVKHILERVEGSESR